MMRSIGLKVALEIACGLTVAMIAFGIFMITGHQQDALSAVDVMEQQTIRQCAVMLGVLLYDMDIEVMTQLAMSYMEHPDIRAMKIADPRRTFVALAKQPENQKIFNASSQEMPVYPYPSRQQTTVVYDERQLGSVEIVFSRETIHAQTEKDIMTMVINWLAMIVFEIFLVLWLARKNVTNRLRHFVNAATQIANGELDLNLAALQARDEMGMLTDAFTRMLEYLRNVAAIATQISRGDLRGGITPHSARDVVGHALVNMSSYLNDMAATAAAIADGDLRREITPKNQYDLLGNAFQQMKNLREIVTNIIDSATQLHHASEHLNQTSAEMAQATAQASQHSRQVSERSRAMSENIETAAVSVEAISGGMQRISENMESVAQSTNTAERMANATNQIIAALEQHSQEITEVIKIITTVMNQTNLLALNATIEATRAGDAGRGFAVVAQEIKQLARETGASAENIFKKIEAIHSSSQQTTKAINDISQIIRHIRALSDATAGSVAQQNALTANMSDTMAEAVRGGQEIVRLVGEMATTAQQTSSGAVEIQSAASSLDTLAAQLQQLVSRFKI